MEYDKIKHLEFVQATISRMANNSFLLKGWSITLVVALFALAERDSNINFAILALFPALSFWGLDAYYLRQERLFRRLYGDICNLTDGKSQTISPFSLDTHKYKKSVDGWFQTLWSPTILSLHGVVVLLVLVVIVGSKFIL